MLYNVGEYHQMKSDHGKFLKRNTWVRIVERRKPRKDTVVTVEDENGVLYRGVSVKKLRKKAR